MRRRGRQADHEHVMRSDAVGEGLTSERMLVVCAQEQERKRIARDLHDLIGQHLTALRLKLELLKCCDSVRLATPVEDLLHLTDLIDHELDFVAWELRAAAVDDLGLIEALRALVGEWALTHHIEANFQADPGSRVARDVENCLYRIAQEALNNVVKHARARHVSVVLEVRHADVILTVRDDGRGFDPREQTRMNRHHRTMGLDGMRERAIICGGRTQIDSTPGAGTTVATSVPIVVACERHSQRHCRRRGDPPLHPHETDTPSCPGFS
jgi:signal transduction histidine kinase